MIPDTVWRWHRWDGLDRDQVHAMFKLRVDVFVVEQACAYPEIDGKDPIAWHLFGYGGHPSGGELVCYARLFAPGDYYAEPAVGRIVIAEHGRGKGLSRALMAEVHRFSEATFKTRAMRLNGQDYLKGFYEGLGYAAVRGPYDEDGILHWELLRSGEASEGS
jgi:ElaA protein